MNQTPYKRSYLHLERVSGCNYDFENDDVISLNVDFSNDELTDDEKLNEEKLEEQQKNNCKYDLLKYKLSKANFNSKNYMNKNTTSQIDHKMDSNCDAYKFELNPQKYSLELSTLSSSSSSSSSFSSLSITMNDKNKNDQSLNSLNSNLSKLDSSLSYIIKFHQVNHQSTQNNTNNNICINQNLNSTNYNSSSNNKTDSSVFTKISTPTTLSSEPSFKLEPKTKLNRNVSQCIKATDLTDCYRSKTRRNNSIKQTLNTYHHHQIQQQQHDQFKKVAKENQMEIKQNNYKGYKSNCNLLDLDDYLLVKIITNLNTIDKLVLQFVCKRFFYIIWSSVHSYKLFKRIDIVNADNYSHLIQYFTEMAQANSKSKTKCRLAHFFKFKRPEKVESKSKSIQINTDVVLKFLFTKLLNRQTYPYCLCVEMILIKDSSRLTDRGIELIIQHCPELNYLCLRNCLNVKTNSIVKLVSTCENLKYLNLNGCFNIENITNLSVDLKSCNNSTSNTMKSNSALCKKINYYLNHYQKTTENPNIELLFNNQVKANYLYLHFVDLSYCSNVNDVCVENISKTCIYLKNLYLRKCKLITDMSLLYIAKYCLNLKELSLSQCSKITDLGVKFLGNDPLLTNSTMNEYLMAHHDTELCRFKMKYLSLAKCNQITDKSLIYLCKLGFFQQIKYFNLRGCVLVTDKFMKYFTGAQYIQKVKVNYQSGNSEKINYLNMENVIKSKHSKLIFPFHLKSLDLARCQISDKSIEYLCRLISIKPDILQRLSIRNCENVSDKGIKLLALNCSHLQHLNVTKCSNITAKSLREVKINCKSCIIQHTNFSFC